MSRRLRRSAAGAAALLALVFALRLTAASKSVERSFPESGTALDNPDRGFYIQVSSSRPESVAQAAREVRVILLAFDIQDFAKKDDLSDEKLEELEDALRMAEKEHAGVVFRAAYGFQKDVEEPKSLKTVRRHIKQISKVLNDYADRLLVVQAGMLGEYGEWHSSRHLSGSESECRENRLYVLEQWERYLDPEIQVAVRRPKFVREAWEEGILTGRLGVHNDALLSTEDDMGTYDDPELDREAELAWARDHLAGQCNGGEMPSPGELSGAENADREFSMLHLSYLNLKYNKDVIAAWSGQRLNRENAREYLEKHLGYRLYISRLANPSSVSREELTGPGMSLRLTFTGTGYARLPEKYKLFLTASNGVTETWREVSLPALNQISNGESLSARLTLAIPEEMADAGEPVTVGVKIAPSWNASERDCVQLASVNFSYRGGVNEFLVLKPGMLSGFKAVPVN